MENDEHLDGTKVFNKSPIVVRLLNNTLPRNHLALGRAIKVTSVENTQVGPFLVIKRLGTNRRQNVFHAKQTEQDRDVALKFIKVPPNIEWAVALDKIDREVDILKKLQHPNLVRVYGAGVHDEKVFFATELIEGESLAAILARRGKLAPDLVVEYGRQIAMLFEYLHQQDVLHSKLSPEKIMISKDGTVKVTDLRLNRSRRRRWDATRRRELDIAAYMAPEQFAEGATNKSDIYSLGVIVFEMLTGKLPYEPDTMGRMTKKKMSDPVPSVATHVMNCPIWLDKIVTQMLQPNPKQRPHTARAVVFAFDEIKKIDRNKKAAVDQLTGSFNPLTAGADKTEANRLLGRKAAVKPEDERPFYTRIPFLLTMLAIIAIAIGIGLVPRSSTSLMEQATELMESESQKDWARARTPLKEIMRRSPDSEEGLQAEEMYYELRRRTLVTQAEGGKVLALQDEQTRMFCDAVAMEKNGRYAEAREIFEKLIDDVDPEGKFRHIAVESKSRLNGLENEKPVPTSREELVEMIKSTALATSEDELVEAKNVLSQVINQLLNDPNPDANRDVLKKAENNLAIVKQRLVAFADARLRKAERNNEAVEESDPDSSESNEGSDEEPIDGGDSE